MAAELDFNNKDEDDRSKDCDLFILKNLERIIAEELMREWVALFLVELEKIENFFSTKLSEYCQEFELLKDTFVKKKYGNKKSSNKSPPIGITASDK